MFTKWRFDWHHAKLRTQYSNAESLGYLLRALAAMGYENPSETLMESLRRRPTTGEEWFWIGIAWRPGVQDDEGVGRCRLRGRSVRSCV